uniref:3-hydroxyisobutyryl-coenzyme A hydrolase n=1 Tax=Prasinoderma coloniale TaxID=156133 RepID=A0A7R9TEU1_9VIRI
MWAELPRVVDEVLAADGDVRCVLLAGEGRAFCAGIDLAHLAQTGAQQAPREGVDGARQREELRRNILRMQDAFTSLERLHCPVVAAVHGACYGAGVDLATAADVRVCSADARFCVKEVDVGLAADVGTLQRLPSIVGHGVATEMSLTARVVGAEEAVATGLCSRAHPDATAMLVAARKLCASIAAKSPLAVAGTKRVLLRVRDSGSVADNLDYVATWNAAQLITEDVVEAAAAARERRRPVYKGLRRSKL